jgi:hypothetical protein
MTAKAATRSPFLPMLPTNKEPNRPGVRCQHPRRSFIDRFLTSFARAASANARTAPASRD